MNNRHARSILITLISLGALVACSADKLEARLQADPQCKSQVNPKTGALLPCPGSGKEFYKSIPALNTKALSPSRESTSGATAISQSSPVKPLIAPVECKPSLHQKSGALMPCPAP